MSTLSIHQRRPSDTTTGVGPTAGQLRSSTDIGAQRFLPLIDLLVLQLLVALGVAIAHWQNMSGWEGGLAGFVVSLLLVIPARGTTLPRLAGSRVGYLWAKRRRVGNAASPDPFDVFTSPRRGRGKGKTAADSNSATVA